jgi:murein DD-endopeptidase MepM/ murein hydrolase activator NlpD
LPHRARPTLGRSIILALGAALLAVPATLAANPEPQAPAEPVVPRAQEPGDTPGYRLPFPSGLDVTIDQGWNTSFSHNGRAAFAYDFGLWEGTPVLAAARGVVSHVHAGETACGGPELRNHANYVTIDHPDGSSTHYGHLLSVAVQEGDVVAQGQELGLSGMTGYTNCLQHLHFARQVQGGPVTDSLPVYFEGYERVLIPNEIVQAPTSCAGSVVAEPDAKGATKVAKPAPGSKAKAPAPAATPAFCGTYFGGIFDGPAYFSRSEDAIRIDRRDVGPGGYWLDEAPDGYSARWLGRFTSASWKYTFSVEVLGGVRVTLDGLPIVDEWSDSPKPKRIEVTQLLGAGAHTIQVEHYSTGGRDLLELDWEPVPFED